MRNLIGGIALAALSCISSPAVASGTMLTSWYGGYFHGRTTANGETYNMYIPPHIKPSVRYKTTRLYQGCVDVVLTIGPILVPS